MPSNRRVPNISLLTNLPRLQKSSRATATLLSFPVSRSVSLKWRWQQFLPAMGSIIGGWIARIFVCSGSTSLKMLSQLVAYLTGHADDYRYHINRGKSLKGATWSFPSMRKAVTSFGWETMPWERRPKRKGLGILSTSPSCRCRSSRD